LQEAVQMAKKVGEGLGASQVLQREVQESWFQGMIDHQIPNNCPHGSPQ
jgi:hypothetical protein